MAQNVTLPKTFPETFAHRVLEVGVAEDLEVLCSLLSALIAYITGHAARESCHKIPAVGVISCKSISCIVSRVYFRLALYNIKFLLHLYVLPSKLKK